MKCHCPAGLEGVGANFVGEEAKFPEPNFLGFCSEGGGDMLTGNGSW